MIKTILADDHKIFCDGLSKLLTDSQHFEVIQKFHNTSDLLETIYSLSFDLLILDFQMPGLDCEDVIQRVRLSKPTLKIIVLSMHEEYIYSKKVLLAGADLYLTKSLDTASLIESIINVINNEETFQKKQVIKSKSILSKQEMVIIRLIASGKTSEAIGNMLSLSPLTIKAHRRNMIKKLGANNSSELIKIAIAKGVI